MTAPTIARPNAGRANRTSMQRRAEQALATNPHRVELTGTLRSLVWPPVCANCGESTDERLTVRKVFLRPRVHGRRRRGMSRHIVTAAEIPYCGGCAQSHRELTPTRSLTHQALGILFTPMLIPIVGSVIMGVIALRAVLGISPSEPYARYAWGIPGLFLFICIWCLVLAWDMTRAGRVEPQSDVTRACDFSDDVSWLFERERRIYSMRHETFARAFADANRERVWTADDDKRTSRRMLALVAAAVVGVVLWAVVVLGPR
jgi:hypothetical protein